MINRKQIHLKDLDYRTKYSLYENKNYFFSNYGLSNSLTNVYLNCPMKFFLKINCVGLKIQDDSTTIFGTLVHNYLEEFYKTKKINYKKMCKKLANKNYNENFTGRLYGVLKAYEHIYKQSDFKEYKILGAEYVLEKQILDIPIKCKIDLKLESEDGTNIIMDHKTTAFFNPERIDAMINLLAIDQQTNLYLCLESDNVPELIYNLVYHPSKKRIRKKENILSFSKRIYEDITHKPDENFKRLSLCLNRNDKKLFLNNFKRKLKNIVRFFKAIDKHGYKAIPFHSDSCLGRFNKPCKFLQICASKKIDLKRYTIGNKVMREYNEDI